jgi:sortase A
VLKIEKLNLEVPIFNGTSDLTLNRGLGRIIGTSRIDQQGNLGIAGHRDSFFRGLKDINVGDTMELKTLTGNDNYKVTSITITTPDDVGVLAPTDDSTITLVTCYPFYFVGHAPKRYIVKAKKEFNPVSS